MRAAVFQPEAFVACHSHLLSSFTSCHFSRVTVANKCKCENNLKETEAVQKLAKCFATVHISLLHQLFELDISIW